MKVSLFERKRLLITRADPLTACHSLSGLKSSYIPNHEDVKLQSQLLFSPSVHELRQQWLSCQTQEQDAQHILSHKRHEHENRLILIPFLHAIDVLFLLIMSRQSFLAQLLDSGLFASFPELMSGHNLCSKKCISYMPSNDCSFRQRCGS